MLGGQWPFIITVGNLFSSFFNKMDTDNIKKRKGGAEKNREKKLKLVEAQVANH